MNRIIEIHAPQWCTPAIFCWILQKDHSRLKVAKGLLPLLHIVLSTCIPQICCDNEKSWLMQLRIHVKPTCVLQSQVRKQRKIQAWNQAFQFETISYHCQTTRNTCKRWEDYACRRPHKVCQQLRMTIFLVTVNTGLLFIQETGASITWEYI